jgi:hypothetical protein
VIKPGRSDRFRHQKTITRGDLRRDLHTDPVKGYPPAETRFGQAQWLGLAGPKDFDPARFETHDTDARLAAITWATHLR